MKDLEKILRATEFVAWISYIAGAVAVCILFSVMFSDVAGRFLFSAPVRGTVEVSEYLLVAIAFLALGFAQLTGTHVRVEGLVSRFPARLQATINIVVLGMVTSFFIMMTMQISQRAYLSWSDKLLLSETTVRLPVWWPSFVAAIGCALLVLALLTQIVRNIIGLITGKVIKFATWTR